MAGSKLKSTVRASSLLEVVISMVIIVAVFGIAMMIYTNVLRSSLSSQKLKAEALLKEAAFTAEHNAVNTAQTFTAEDFRIEQEIKPYRGNTALIELHLTAYDQNQQKIAELQEVLLNQP